MEVLCPNYFIMKLTSFLPLFAVLLAFAACQKVDEFTEAEIVSDSGEFAIPLIKASTNIEDLLENFDDITFIEITPDNVIHLRYKGDVLSQSAEEFLLDARDSVPPFLPILDTVFALPFSSPDQLEVDLAIYKTGRVSLALESNYQGIVDLTVRLPQATKDGQPMTITTQFESPTPSPFYFPPEFVDMAGYLLQPENDSIFLEYEAYTETGERITLPTLALVNQDIFFGYLEGYLGNFKHNGDHDTIYIEFFENWIQGDVFFEDPTILIHIENSFGVPTRSVIDTFDILTADGLRIPLESVFIDTAENGIDFPYPENPGEVASTTFVFNAENSNIEDVLGSRPIALDYDVDARMNPDTLTDLRGFITDSSYYNIQVEVDLPLHGWAKGFGVADTFNVDLDSYEDVKEAEFKLVTDNGMPLEIEGQLYFVDSNGAVIDSLFNERTKIIGSAPVDADGNVTAETTKTSYSTFSAERFEHVRSAEQLILEAYFSTYNNGQQSVRALKGQGAEFRMGMKLKTN